MKHLLLIFIILIAGCQVKQPVVTYEAEQPVVMSTQHFLISSPAFEHNGMIPSKYTCQGEDINPPLTITDIPDKTQSLALIIEDPDAPAGIWDHWIVWNIPVTEKIEENSIPGLQGKNSWGKAEYGGPCPPSGTHRYFFKLFALDSELDISDKESLMQAMSGHILEQAEIIGLFSKG